MTWPKYNNFASRKCISKCHVQAAILFRLQWVTVLCKSIDSLTIGSSIWTQTLLISALHLLLSYFLKLKFYHLTWISLAANSCVAVAMSCRLISKMRSSRHKRLSKAAVLPGIYRRKCKGDFTWVKIMGNYTQKGTMDVITYPRLNLG